MLRLLATPTRRDRLVDALLGVSRRRRRLAFLAIVGGLSSLRPMLRRLALVAVVLVALAVRL